MRSGARPVDDLGIFDRIDGNEPIVSVKRDNQAVTLTIRNPDVDRFIFLLSPLQARELAVRLIDAARVAGDAFLT